MAPADKPRLCANCGVEVAPADTSCWRCFRPLPPVPVAEHAPAPRRRRLQIPASTVVVALFLIGLGAYLWYVRTSPSAALTAYLRAEASGDVRAMYDLMSYRSRDIFSPEAAAQSRPADAGRLDIAIRSVRVERDRAEITANVAGASSPTRIYMVRENGRWRVDMVEAAYAGTRGLLSPRDWLMMRRGAAAER